MNLKQDGTVIQRSLVRDSRDYKTSGMHAPKLGVILEVRAADDIRNRSAREHQDLRGFIAEATVYLVDDCATLQHVLITPAVPSGLWNFEELLPRSSTKTVKGDAIDANLTGSDCYDLDGDWCIVEFLNGNIQSPFIVRYFPNPRNVYDCATSGKGNPTFSTSKGTSLNQAGRYFNRTNGVEFVINKNGDLWLSTTRSGNTPLMGAKSSDGRFPTLNNGTGGAIMINVRPSKTFELSWDEQVDGISANGSVDPSLPQRNPAVPSPHAAPLVNTHLLIDKQKVVFTTPITFIVRSKQTALIDAPTITLGEGATDFAALANKVLAELQKLTTAVNTHVHAGVTPGSGITGTISVPITDPSPVASSVVQVKE